MPFISNLACNHRCIAIAVLHGGIVTTYRGMALRARREAKRAFILPVIVLFVDDTDVKDYVVGVET